jgi:hypothetical protein
MNRAPAPRPYSSESAAAIRPHVSGGEKAAGESTEAITSRDRRLYIPAFSALEENMSISRWIEVTTDAVWSSAVLLVLLAASLLFALLSAPDTRGLAIELGLSDEAAATIPSCFCVAPELDVAIPPHAARLSGTPR